MAFLSSNSCQVFSKVVQLNALNRHGKEIILWHFHLSSKCTSFLLSQSRSAAKAKCLCQLNNKIYLCRGKFFKNFDLKKLCNGGTALIFLAKPTFEWGRAYGIPEKFISSTVQTWNWNDIFWFTSCSLE